MNVELELLTHPKYVRLRKAVGPEALEYLLRLWGHCATNKRGEKWAGADASYVECVCNWPGEAGMLFASLVETGFVDELPSDHGVGIHDWEEQNSFTVANWWRRNATRRNCKDPTSTKAPTKDMSMDEPWMNHGLSTDKEWVYPPFTHSLHSDHSSHSEQPEIPGEQEFIAAFMTDGIPEDYLRRQFEKFNERRTWLNALGQLVDWRRTVRNRWQEDRAKWQTGGAIGPFVGGGGSDRPWNLQKKIAAEEDAIRLHPANSLGTRSSPNPTPEELADLANRRARVREWKEKMAGGSK